jgi:hypothetical protein
MVGGDMLQAELLLCSLVKQDDAQWAFARRQDSVREGSISMQLSGKSSIWFAVKRLLSLHIQPMYGMHDSRNSILQPPTTCQSRPDLRLALTRSWRASE